MPNRHLEIIDVGVERQRIARCTWHDQAAEKDKLINRLERERNNALFEAFMARQELEATPCAVS